MQFNFIKSYITKKSLHALELDCFKMWSKCRNFDIPFELFHVFMSSIQSMMIAGSIF